MVKPELTPERLDSLFVGRVEKLWGANAISRALGLSPDTVQRLAQDPSVPIYKPAGRYFAYRSELERWLRSKPNT